MQENIIYFDNAATTFPKPQSVIDAVNECLCDCCGNSGRGSHIIAMRSAEAVFEARESLSSLFGAAPERVVFTLNTTYALNMAIKGVMSRGGHILISNMEHNSTLRPVSELARRKKADYGIYDVVRQGVPLSPNEIISDIITRLRPDTKAIVCNHASNICSITSPIREIGKFCRRHGLIFIVDAAQSAGRIDIDVKRDLIDILCLPAHKGIYAAQGVGMMILGDNVSPDTLIEGGNGSNSLDRSMGSVLPEKFEGGTLPTPAIASISASVRFLRGIGLDNIARYEERLWAHAFSALGAIKDIKIYAPSAKGSILLFNVIGRDPEEIGRALSERGFCLRTGYHCAPLAHSALGTPEGGAIRIGFGVFNTEEEIDLLAAALDEVI